jgi:hypothetical protein
MGGLPTLDDMDTGYAPGPAGGDNDAPEPMEMPAEYHRDANGDDEAAPPGGGLPGGAAGAGGMPDVSTMFSANPRVRAADAKLDSIIQDMTTRQQQISEQGKDFGQRQAMLSLASGLLAPTRTGGIGESIGNAVGKVGPVLAQNRQMQRMDEQGIYGLRLKAASLEQERARMEAQRQYSMMMYGMQRKDRFRAMGLATDDNGNITGIDPTIAQAKGTIAGAEAKSKKLGELDALGANTTGDASTGKHIGGQLTDDEIKQFNIPPGSGAVWEATSSGIMPKVISRASTEQISGYDEQGKPIWENKTTALTPTMKTGVQSQLDQTAMLLPHINWLIDQAENGKVGFDAFGVPGKVVAGFGKVAGMTDADVAPEVRNYREAMGLTAEPLKHILARDPTHRMSNEEANDIEPYIPHNEWFTNKKDTLMKLREVRSRIISNAEEKAKSLGLSDTYTPKIKEWSSKIERRDDFDPAPLFDKAGRVGGDKDAFQARQVRKGSKMATVSTQQELDEATHEGWK